ncbi:Transposon Tf2-9 polyprotein [Dissostichus eleginoides]|uniref:Transposon Tf2-9 polyprotein n=1 Tax=Dissostichus eleginoides TaxID=100907 RepID=A0AAD9FH45_DISEL|nr:Transposon Tf2-9 polyprotein [Dissostichus eleginoides]
MARSATVSSVTDPQHTEALRVEVSTLLAKGGVREVLPGELQAEFYSRYFLVPKKDGRLRPILVLSGLNRFLRPLKLNILTNPRVRQAIQAGDRFATINLRDAYFQIPIWEGHRRFLRFACEEKIFEFCVLPFGISLDPRTFTRCVDAVLGPAARRLHLLPLGSWLCASQR